MHNKSSGKPTGNDKEGTGIEKANPGEPAGGIGKETDPQDEDAPREPPAPDGLAGTPGISIEKDGRQGITSLYILLVT